LPPRAELRAVDFDLCHLAASCVALSRPAAKARRLEVSLVIGADASGPVCGDPISLRQVLANLISQSIDFTRAGRVRVSITRDGEGNGLLEVCGGPRGRKIAEDDDSLEASRRLVGFLGGALTVLPGRTGGATLSVRFPLRAAKGESSGTAIELQTLVAASGAAPEAPKRQAVAA
jgi:hypothetical protein